MAKKVKDLDDEDDDILLPEAIDESFMVALVPKAIDFAKRAHADQVRDDGTPYLAHVEAVAEVVRKQSDTHAYLTALLHDVLETSRVTYEELAQAFTEDVAKDVKLLTRYPDLEFDLYMKRIVIKYVPFYIKLVDRLDNLKSLSNLLKAKPSPSIVADIEAYKSETLSVFLPIARSARYAKLPEFAQLIGEIEASLANL